MVRGKLSGAMPNPYVDDDGTPTVLILSPGRRASWPSLAYAAPPPVGTPGCGFVCAPVTGAEAGAGTLAGNS